ncbi:winged helix-turn-helix transcriptional regulator, partial [Candidatus Methanoperedens nitratireducens]
LDHIKKNPGVNFGVISNETGVNRGTLSYHLKILDMHDKIKVYKSRYFENHMKFNDDEQKILNQLKKDMPRKIIKILMEHPGASRKEISGEIGITDQAVSWYMKHLRTDGIIVSETLGQFNKYYVSAKAVQIMQNVLQNEPLKAI